MTPELIELIIGAVILAAVIFLIVKIFTKPIKFIFKLLLNAVCGYVLLFIVNFFGDAIGLNLEYNTVNILVSGIFGIPGVIALAIFQYVL